MRMFINCYKFFVRIKIQAGCSCFLALVLEGLFRYTPQIVGRFAMQVPADTYLREYVGKAGLQNQQHYVIFH